MRRQLVREDLWAGKINQLISLKHTEPSENREDLLTFKQQRPLNSACDF